MFLETVHTSKNMFQGPALRAPYSNQSVRPSIRPRSHLLSPWPNITHTSPTWGLWIKGVRRLLTHFLGLKLRSWHNYRKKNPCPNYIFSLFGPIWLTLHPQSFFGQSMHDYQGTFLVNVISDHGKKNQCISYLPLALIGLSFKQTEPFGNCCAATLIKLSLTVKCADHCISF